MDKFPSNIIVKWQSIGEIVYTVKKRGENYMKVLILYFSATGNTAKMAKVIEERFAEVGCKGNGGAT